MSNGVFTATIHRFISFLTKIPLILVFISIEPAMGQGSDSSICRKNHIIPVSYNYSVISVYPHDPRAYTQGLLVDGGFLYEGTGLFKRSTLRKVNLETGAILQSYSLPDSVFGEGVATYENKLVQITWKSQVAYVFNKEAFQLEEKKQYNIKEGWGLTFNGQNLIMSDGSSVLYFLDKDNFSELSRVEVCDEKGPVSNLNELEYINGKIWANKFLTDTILIINPENGNVQGVVNMAGLLKKREQKKYNAYILNGIAYDAEKKKIFVTGKNWPKLFEITIHEKD